MIRLAILGVALGLLVVPAQAQTKQQKLPTVEFNGMVFDAPPPEHYAAGSRGYVTPRTAEPNVYQPNRARQNRE